MKAVASLTWMSLVVFSLTPSPAAEEWESILNLGLLRKHSQTRHDALKQVDTTSVKGLRAIWNVLDTIAPKKPDYFDWYVRQGAFEALSRAQGEDVEKEILRLLKAKKYYASKEAIVYSVIFRIRKQFEKDFGQNDDNKIMEAKYLLRKTRGVDYYGLVMPSIDSGHFGR